ncbi:MAG: DUF2163 domain-containing protein [Betaproteobacteria bacterium]|nr:DUF2163 domain-containing protein [Betaproteobacteria bacterium]
MKTISSAFLTMLQTSETLVMANLYQFTLPSGSIFYWTDAQQNITYNGNTYLAAYLDSQPGFERGSTKTSIGLQSDDLEIDILYDTNTRINGMTPAAFALAGGFDHAQVIVSKALAPNWSNPVVNGVVSLFTGIVGEIQADSGKVKLTVNSTLRLLNTAFPRNYFLPQCNHALFDSGCTLLASNFAVAGTVSGSSNTLTYFGSNTTKAANYFALGYVVWLTGANAGLKSFVKSTDGSGNFTLAYPLGAIPSSGDTFTAYPGCDKTLSTCLTTFNNLQHNRSFAFVPTPETLEAGPGSSPPAAMGGLGGSGISQVRRGPGGTLSRF